MDLMAIHFTAVPRFIGKIETVKRSGLLYVKESQTFLFIG
jgi:hypothetical protein